MKIGTIIKTGQKGQIVIPKEIREKLGIDQNALLHMVVRDNGFYVFPVKGIIQKSYSENPFLKLLEKTRGTWADEDWETIEKRRKKIELEASKKRKRLW